jgi:hypothetical protein
MSISTRSRSQAIEAFKKLSSAGGGGSRRQGHSGGITYRDLVPGRVGQKNGLVYQWAQKGMRPPQPKDQRYANAYLFSPICPARDTGAALVLPRADAITMQHHLNEISRCVATGPHAVLTLDKAG